MGSGLTFLFSGKNEIFSQMKQQGKLLKSSDKPRVKLSVVLKDLCWIALSICLTILKVQPVVRRNSDILTTKTDKSNDLAVMDKIDYRHNVRFLLDDDTTRQKVRSNPYTLWIIS